MNERESALFPSPLSKLRARTLPRLSPSNDVADSSFNDPLRSITQQGSYPNVMESPLIGALAHLHSSDRGGPPSLHQFNASRNNGGGNQPCNEEGSAAEDQSVGQVYDMSMLLGFLIKSMWTCETMAKIHSKVTKQATLKAHIMTLMVFTFSAVTTGALWSILSTCPTPMMTWSMAIIATVATMLKMWSEYRNYGKIVNDHTKAVQEYRRLHTKIDIKLRLKRIKVSDFEKLLTKLMELEFETPLHFEMPDYDAAAYMEILDREKVITVKEMTSTHQSSALPHLVHNNTEHGSPSMSV